MGGFWSEQVLGSLDVGTIRNTTTVSIIFQLVLMHVDALNLSSNMHEFMPAAWGHCMLLYQQHIQVRYGKLASLHCMKHVTSPFCIFLNTILRWPSQKAPDHQSRCRGEHGVQRGTSETKLEGAVWTAPRPEKSPVSWGGTVSWGLLNIADGFVFGMKWLPQMINTRGWWNSISWPYKRFWLD